MKTSSNEISDFGDLQVPQNLVKQKRDQFSAFSESHKGLMKKLKDIGLKIQEKQKMYADLAIQSAQASMVEARDDNKQQDYMVDGITEENNNNG